MPPTFDKTNHLIDENSFLKQQINTLLDENKVIIIYLNIHIHLKKLISDNTQLAHEL